MIPALTHKMRCQRLAAMMMINLQWKKVYIRPVVTKLSDLTDHWLATTALDNIEGGVNLGVHCTEQKEGIIHEDRENVKER